MRSTSRVDLGSKNKSSTKPLVSLQSASGDGKVVRATVSLSRGPEFKSTRAFLSCSIKAGYVAGACQPSRWVVTLVDVHASIQPGVGWLVENNDHY